MDDNVYYPVLNLKAYIKGYGLFITDYRSTEWGRRIKIKSDPQKLRNNLEERKM
jgi:hypothetical protein